MIGIDVVEIERIRLSDAFIDFILTDDEKAELQNRTGEKTKKAYLAGRFAAKEAIFKATQDPAYLSFCILNSPSGAPYVKDHPELSVSISHDRGIAAAVVLLQR